MKKRLMSLFGAVVMLVTCLSQGIITVSASAETDRISAQIKTTYSIALSLNGGTSFDGWCGKYVSYQLRALGITSSSDADIKGNGNKMFANANEGKTSQGYQKTKYSGNNCLYDIVNTYAGQNVYNIFVSWTYQWKGSVSNPGAGHATFIHAIINDMVYFSESYATRGIAEGGVHVCSLSEFYSRYNGSYGAALGAVHFTAKNFGSNAPSYSDVNIENGKYYIKHNATGKYMNVEGAGNANKTNIQLSDFNGGSAQLFTIDYSSETNGGYSMKPDCSSRMVNGYGNTISSGANVCLWDNTNHTSQRWEFKKVSGGYIILNMQNTGCAMDVSGSNIYLNSYNGNSNQIWSLQTMVTYNANGGSGAPAAQMKNFGETLYLSSIVPVRSGYTFKGWSLNSNATTPSFYGGSSYTKDGNVVLYAVWSKVNTYSGLDTIDGVTYLFENGKPKTSFLGMYQHSDGQHYYIAWGKFNNMTGLKTISGTTYLLKGGIWQNDYTGLYTYGGKKYYIVSGKVNPYNGLKTVDGEKYLFKNGIVRSDFTGVHKHGDGKYYYITWGKFNAYNGLKTMPTGEKYVFKNGVVKTDFTGLHKHGDGKYYYITWGKFNPYNGLKTINGVKYVLNKGILNTSVTGYYAHAGVSYYITGGVAVNGLKTAPDGKKYLYDNGLVKTSFTGVHKHGDGKLYYIVEGKFNAYNGLKTAPDGKKYLYDNGLVKTSFLGMHKHGDGKYYYIAWGQFNSMTGLKTIRDTTYLLKGGIWQNGYNGTYTQNGVTYTIQNGKAV